MSPEDFADGVQEIRRACDLTDAPRQEVLLVWYSHLKQVETREWRSIVRRMIHTETAGFPRNFVAAVSAYAEPRSERRVDLAAIERAAGDDEAAREFFASLGRIGRSVPSGEGAA